MLEPITNLDKGIVLHTIDEGMLEEMAKNQVEVDRASRSFGKSQSQFMVNCMTLDSHTPFRNLRQLLAEIEKKKLALSEAHIKQKRDKLKLEELKSKELTPMVMLDIEEIELRLKNSSIYIEAALKEIYSMEQAYNEIKEANGIENWDEEDFENEEEEYHIKRAFTQGIGDLMNGALSQGNNIYFRQIGINPITAALEIKNYINKVEQAVINGELITMEHQYQFLEACFQKYKGCSKIVQKKNNLKSLSCKRALYKEIKNNE